MKRWRLNPVGPMPMMPSMEPAPRAGLKKSCVESACGNGVVGARSLRKQSNFSAVPEYSEENMNLHPCSRCGRKFLFDRISYHESVCKGDVKRRVFDSSRQRAVGDADGGMVSTFGSSRTKRKGGFKSPAAGFPAAGGIPKTHWREQHREFIEAIRAARKAGSSSRAMWGSPSVKAPPARVDNRQRAPPAVIRHQRGMQMRAQRPSQLAELPPPGQGLDSRRPQPRQSYGRAFGGGGERFPSTGGMGGGGGGCRIINDNTTSLGMLQAFGRA